MSGPVWRRLNWHLALPGLVITVLGIAIVLFGIFSRGLCMVLGGCFPLALGSAIVKLAAFRHEVSFSNTHILQRTGDWRAETVRPLAFRDVTELLIHGADEDGDGMWYSLRATGEGNEWITVESSEDLERIRREAQQLAERIDPLVPIREEIEPRTFQRKAGDLTGDRWRLYIRPQTASRLRRIAVPISWVVGFPILFVYSVSEPSKGLPIFITALLLLWATRRSQRVRVDVRTGQITKSVGTLFARPKTVAKVTSISEIVSEGCELHVRLGNLSIHLQDYEDEDMSRLAVEDLRKLLCT